MKTWSIVLAMVMALVLSAGIAEAAKGAKPLSGTISKIDGATLTITPRAKKGSTETPADVTVTTTDSTKVTIKGETKAVSDLAVGMRVRVTLDEDGKTATDIVSGRAKPAESAPATQAGQ